MLLQALTLLALGDSLVAGGHFTISPNPIAWPELIGAENIGQGGTTSHDWLRTTGAGRIGSLAAVDVVLVQLGSVDALSFQMPREEYGENMAGIVDNLLDRGAAAVLLMGPPDPTVEAPVLEALLDSYHDELAAICDVTDAVTCGPDLRDVLEAGTDHYEVCKPEPARCDRIHPTQLGHQAIADAVEATLLPEPVSSQAGCTVLGALAALWRWVRCSPTM